MVETLTLTRLGITGPLTRTLASTNPIWVFDLTGQRRFAVAAGRQAMTLNPIAAPWALSLIRSVGPAAQGCGPDLPSLKRACTTQPRSAGKSGPHPTVSAALLDGEARWSALMFRLWQESTRTRTRERLRCSITPAPCWRASRLRSPLRASRVCLGVLTRTGARIQRIGIEGSGSLGRPVTVALAAAGYDVREVQANRTNERRRRRHRAKTDITDAQAIAAETLTDSESATSREAHRLNRRLGPRLLRSDRGVNPSFCSGCVTSPNSSRSSPPCRSRSCRQVARHQSRDDLPQRRAQDRHHPPSPQPSGPHQTQAIA